MTEAEALEEAARLAGGQSALARALGQGVKQGHVWYWLHKQGRAPAERVLEIERLTGVPRTALRPDIYPPTPAEAAE